MSQDLFESFWSAYPRRVAKATARKAFAKAIKLTTLETMLAAIESYKAHKPEWMAFKHPATWLNSEGWEDEWETERPQTSLTAARSILQRLERESEHGRQETLIDGNYDHAQQLPSTEWH